MPVKSTEKHEVNEKKAISTADLSCRAIVQRFLLNHTGYFFSVTHIQVKLKEENDTPMNRKTIYAALKEIEALQIGLELKSDRVGRHNIPINLYRIKK